MATLPGPIDNDQQNTRQRNRNLAQLLNGGWNDEHISTIRREPTPTNPPDPNGPKQGQWIAETV